MSRFEVLLLNANYEPLNVCSLRRTFALLSMGKAEVIEGSGGMVRTGSSTFEVPSVVRMTYQVKRPVPQLRLSRHSVLARDNHTCQYCGSRRDLTIDHVVPRWVGGPHTWENLVTCCRRCNLKKAGKSVEQAGMKLRRKPRRPKFIPYLSLPQYLKAVERDDWSMFLPIFEEFAPQSRRDRASVA